jgi:hypothetical protein
MIFDDFKTFCLPYLSSHDNDPVYPVLKAVFDNRQLNILDRIWHTFLYLTWYNLGSAEKAFQLFPVAQIINSLEVWPTGTERRGFRGERGTLIAQQMINRVVSANWIKGFLDVFNKPFSTPEQRWTYMYWMIQKIPYCGTWAAYKWCDLCKNVLGAIMSAPDIGMGGKGKNAGPVPGMVQLTGENWVICAENIQLQRQFYNRCLQQGIPFQGMEEMETALCDFNSLTHGFYYVGHDIDVQQEHLQGLPQVYWDARKAVFPHNFLGELNGWTGCRKELKTIYSKTKRIFSGGIQ